MPKIMHPPNLDRLNRILLDLRRPLIALSGGLDSRFLAHAACRLRDAGVAPVLVHFRGPHVPEGETAAAESFAAARGLPLHVRDCDPLAVPEVRANGPRRCYHCKYALFSGLGALRGTLSGDGALIVCDGTNASDLALYRPGLQALRELGVRSPLAEAGLDKEDVRAAARATGLENPEQQARPCLLTRFAYGLEPTVASLHAAGRTEAALAGIIGSGENFRLRLFAPAGDIPGKYLPFTVELHLERPLAPSEEAAVRARIAAQGFFCRSVRVLERASGQYDAAAGLLPERGTASEG